MPRKKVPLNKKVPEVKLGEDIERQLAEAMGVKDGVTGKPAILAFGKQLPAEAQQQMAEALRQCGTAPPPTLSAEDGSASAPSVISVPVEAQQSLVEAFRASGIASKPTLPTSSKLPIETEHKLAELSSKVASQTPKDDLQPPPGKATILYNLASELYARGEYEKALKYVDAALAHIQSCGLHTSLVVFELKATLFLQMGSWRECIATCDQCIGLRHDKYIGFWLKAIALHELARLDKGVDRKWAEAIGAYQRTLQVSAHDFRVKEGLEICVEERMRARRGDRPMAPGGEARVKLRLFTIAMREPSRGTNRFPNKPHRWAVRCLTRVETVRTRPSMAHMRETDEAERI